MNRHTKPVRRGRRRFPAWSRLLGAVVLVGLAVVAATVVSAESKPLPGLQRGPLRALVTNVCLSGELEIVNSMRCKILNSTPISLVGPRTIHTATRVACRCSG